MIKAAAVGLAASLIAPVIKRGSPELSLTLSVAVAAVIATLTVTLCGGIVAAADAAAELSGLSPAIYAPVLKCVGIGLLAKLGAELCRDAGQGGTASAVELAGAASALCAALPLLKSFLEMVGGFV